MQELTTHEYMHMLKAAGTVKAQADWDRLADFAWLAKFISLILSGKDTTIESLIGKRPEEAGLSESEKAPDIDTTKEGWKEAAAAIGLPVGGDA